MRWAGCTFHQTKIGCDQLHVNFATIILILLLLQLAPACFIYPSSLCSAADFSLQIGDLASVSTADAINFMSGSTIDKGKWLQLANSSLYPEALLRFMVLGPPHAGVSSSSSWGPQEEEEATNKGRLLATRDASVAESTFHSTIKDLGSLQVDAWMLGFVCIDSMSACESLAPAAIVNRLPDETSASKPSLEFTIVWNEVVLGSRFITLIANSITANLINVSKEEKTIIEQAKGRLQRFSLKVLSKGVETCPSRAFTQVAVRSSLDAAYNLGPYACYKIDSEFESVAGSEYLLVLGMQNWTAASGNFSIVGIQGPAIHASYEMEGIPLSQAYDLGEKRGSLPLNSASTSSRPHPTAMVSCIERWLHKYQNVQLAKCERSPHLIVSTSTDGPVVMACWDTSSPDCLQLDNKMKISNDTEYCESMILLAFNKSSVKLAKDNHHTFNYSASTGNICEAAHDTLPGSCNSGNDQFGYNRNLLAVNEEALSLMLFTALNDKYAMAHSNAFQLANGSPTDIGTAVLALVGGAISVLTATIPVTNFFLRLLIKFRGSLHGLSNRSPLIILLSVLNVAVAFASYGMVVDVTVSEKQREKEFKTWAVIAESVEVNEMGLQLQALYVVHGTSVYTSAFNLLIWGSVSILAVLVGVMTHQRSCSVLKKLELLKANESSGSLQDDFKAIEMGTAEYMSLLELQRQSRSAVYQDIGRDGTPTAESAVVANDIVLTIDSPVDMTLALSIQAMPSSRLAHLAPLLRFRVVMLALRLVQAFNLKPRKLME